MIGSVRADTEPLASLTRLRKLADSVSSWSTGFSDQTLSFKLMTKVSGKN